MERVKGIEPSCLFLNVLHISAVNHFIKIAFLTFEQSVVYSGRSYEKSGDLLFIYVKS